MISNPTVTICCMTYNQENYILKALEGFTKQITSFDVEIIVHDDNSTDSTREIIEKYCSIDARITTIFQKENKYSKKERITYKYLFPKCRGKYIALCDGDDYWTDPLKLQKQVDFLKKNKGYGIVGTRMITLFQKQKKYVDWQHPKNKKHNLDVSDLIDGNFIYASSALFKNDFTIEEWWNLFPFGDWPLYINQIKNRKIKILDENMGVYRVHENGIHSGISRLKQHHKEIECLSIFMQFSNHSSDLKNLMMKSIEKKTDLLFDDLTTENNKLAKMIKSLETKQNNLELELQNQISLSNSISEKRDELEAKLISIKKTITYKTILKLEVLIRKHKI
ncbi:glycosyltransferase family 2 protein [Wenyingzhuangia sp. IMCC45533]